MKEESTPDRPDVEEKAARPGASFTRTALKVAVRLAIFSAAVAYVLYNLDFADRVEYGGASYRLVDTRGDVFIVDNPAVRGKTLEILREDAVPIPGVGGLVKNASIAGLILFFLVHLAVYFSTAFRWYLLLRVQRAGISLPAALRLTFIGAFFNVIFPGLTMGDLVKAVYAARRSDRKVEAVASIAVDRMFGLVGIAILAGIAVIPVLRRPDYAQVALVAAALVSVAAVFAVIFVSRTVQGVVLDNRIVKRLPGYGVLERIAASGLLYREAKGVVVFSVLVSVAGHAVIVIAHWGYALSLGVEASLAVYFAVVPVALFVTSIPVAPGGWGVGEAAYKYFFARAGQSGAESVVLSVVYRLATVMIGLAGAVLLVCGRRTTPLARGRLSEELSGELAGTGLEKGL